MYTQFIPNIYQENSQTGGRRGEEGGDRDRQHSVKVSTQQISRQKTTH